MKKVNKMMQKSCTKSHNTLCLFLYDFLTQICTKNVYNNRAQKNFSRKPAKISHAKKKTLANPRFLY